MLTPAEIAFTTAVTDCARWYCNTILLPNARRLEGKAISERITYALLLPFLVHLRELLKDEVCHAVFMERLREYAANASACLEICKHVHKAIDTTTVSEDSARALLVVLINIIHAPRDIMFQSKDLFD